MLRTSLLLILDKIYFCDVQKICNITAMTAFFGSLLTFWIMFEIKERSLEEIQVIQKPEMKEKYSQNVSFTNLDFK